LLIWKVYGRRLDGWSNDDFAHETVPGDPKSLVFQGKPFTSTPHNPGQINLAFIGSVMPPPAAVREGKVKPLTDEDRLTLVRWIDLGCPIDLDYDSAHPQARGRGWMEDDNRPILTVTYPQAGINNEFTRILIGMYDYDSGLDMDSFTVTADFPIGDIPAGQNVASHFKALPGGRWEVRLATALTALPRGKLTVSIKDKQGNVSRVERTFSVDARSR
jgi:hypothetical protein